MKFISISMFDTAKAADVAAASDKVAKIPGVKLLNQYVCQGMLFPGVPANTMVVVTVIEAESNEALAAHNYPVVLAGATSWNVPVLEMDAGQAAKEEKQYRE